MAGLTPTMEAKPTKAIPMAPTVVRELPSKMLTTEAMRNTIR